MADGHARRRLLMLLLAWALVVAVVDVARLLTHDRDEPVRPVAASPARSATHAPPSVQESPTSPPEIAPPTTTPNSTRVGFSAQPPSQQAGTSAPASGPAVEPAAPAPPPSVSCGTDLALADAPDAPYNFLCRQGDTPVTWPNDHINVFASGLSPEQRTALTAALPQWESKGRFTVAMVSSAVAANVTVSSRVLDNTEDGRTFVHYVCTTTCAFDRADIELSSTRKLTNPLWITTVLHELGHAAGLNHVARNSQVMYPEIGLNSPTAYGDGDAAGFEELAKHRTA